LKLQAYRVACSQPDFHPFPESLSGLTPPPAPVPLRVRVHPLVSFTFLQSTDRSDLLRAIRLERLPWGSVSPSRHQPEESTCERASHSRPTVRPRRFSRPRRLTPPRALQVCFTLLPRPGFTFQGFSRCQAASPRRRPVPSCRWPAVSCNELPRLHQTRPPRLQGFFRAAIRGHRTGV